MTTNNEAPFIRGKVKDKFDTEISPQQAADLALTQAIANHVETHYPGHPWAINVDHLQGMALISIPLFMGSNNYYFIPLETLKSDPGMRSVTNACGHILELYNIPRAAFTQQSFMDTVNRIPKHKRGSVWGEIPK